MVTRGCRTCVQRRVKCDTARPICERCAKGKRTCVWSPNEQGGLRFLDESSFAKGKARRPRASKFASPPAINAAVISLPAPQPAPTLSLDDHAFQYWVQTNVTQADTLHEAAHEWHTHVVPYWMKAKPGSCLHLAISTLSRAVFGRARGVPQALAQADRSYSQCLYKTQQAVCGQTHEDMDELLLTTLMMGYFENIRYNNNTSELGVRKTDAVGARYTNVFCHYEGAMGLLWIRRASGVNTDSILDKVARRQIVSFLVALLRNVQIDNSQIRASVLRGNPVPDWLQNGEEFGEAGPALQLDSFMVRVAAFRARALAFFPQVSAGLPTSTPDLEFLAHTGKHLEDDLVDWAESMSEEWERSKEDLPATTEKASDYDACEGHRNVYTSHGHASLWIRQRALRLIINSIFIKFISVRMQTSADQAHLLWKQNHMRRNLEIISQELCADMLYFFKASPSGDEDFLMPVQRTSVTTEGEPTILPSLASMLAWPLAIAVSTENVPEAQRKWLQGKLGIVADSLGDAVLHDVRRRGAFVF
jgi:hypothetical protein